MFKNKTGRPRRSLKKWTRIAVAGAAAMIGIGTLGVAGASAGHSTLEATIGCEETTWTLDFDGTFFAAPFINLVRVRLIDGPAEALAQVPADGHWDMMSTPVANPIDFDHAVTGNIHFSLTFPQTLQTVALKFQINFVDLHIGVPGPPIEHPDTELIRNITRTHNCFSQETTTTTAPTTTLPGEPAAVQAVEPLCISDAPFIDVTFGPHTQYVGKTAHITFLDINGNTVGTHQAPYEPNGVVRLVYPGASVDAQGNATDWPGWKLAPNGDWIPDASDNFLREGLTVRVEVNPTAEAKVSYPPATSGCANPDIPPPPPCEETTTTGAGSGSTTPTPPECTTPPSSRTLPSTGKELPLGIMAGGLVSLAVGVLAVTTTRRRTHTT
jgi:hypothetical protein